MIAKEARALTKQWHAAKTIDISKHMKVIYGEIEEACMVGKSFSELWHKDRVKDHSFMGDTEIWNAIVKQLRKDGYKVSHKMDDGTDVLCVFDYWEVSW